MYYMQKVLHLGKKCHTQVYSFVAGCEISYCSYINVNKVYSYHGTYFLPRYEMIYLCTEPHTEEETIAFPD
jgi:hypothetical protein